jgi:Pentapeptide repeats (8 copies)
MAHDPRLQAFSRLVRAAVAGLAVVLALLGIVLGALRLGWHRPAHAASLAGQALAQTARLALSAGWPLLVAAAGLVLSLFLSDRRGRATLGRLRAALGRLWAAPPLRVARWLFTAAGLLATLVVVIAVLPQRFTADRHFDTAADELKAQNDVRTTLLQALAGGVLLLGAYFTYRQLRVTREGQLTDRYTKAVEQLGSEHLDVRLGGIYALERIARDSPPDRATIEEVLTAFVRGHAPWLPPPAAPPKPTDAQQPTTAATQQLLAEASPADTGTVSQPDKRGAEPRGPAADVQAVVTVLGRRKPPPGGLRPLDLIRVDLHGARLRYANLQDAWLDDANLQDASLSYANLQDAVLSDANLRDAWLNGADLRGANLYSADLQGANLYSADLQGARLRYANLQDAWLDDANLQDAQLDRANLRAARLNDANLQGANLQGANLDGANLQGASLDGADLQGAQANEATRWPSDWDRAQAKARGVRYRLRPLLRPPSD